MQEQFTCDHCEATFQRREHCLRHLRSHTKEKPFQCSICGQAFGRVDSLSRHYSSAHPPPISQKNSLRQEERSRVARACKCCSTSKVRCDGRLPCEKCLVSSKHCYYEEPKKRKARARSTGDRTAKHHAPDGTHIEPGSRHSSEEQGALAAPSQTPFFTPLLDTSTREHSLTAPVHDQNMAADAENLLGFNEIASYSNASDTPHISSITDFQSDLDSLGWMTGSLDSYLWPISFDLSQEFDVFQNTANADAKLGQTGTLDTTCVDQESPHPPDSDITDLYSRAHSPALDQDAVEIRQYHPTLIELDAPLHFPDIDLSSTSILGAEQENFAHVPPLPSKIMDAITQLMEEMQQDSSHFPPFRNLKTPPQTILNTWIQLYFEYFHPVFPVLHKPTFLSSGVDPLLVLCVAGIGAQFSTLPNARTFARGIHELTRRRSSSLCEKHNQLGRTVWMTQVVMLNNLAMSHSGERRDLEVAEINQAISVTLARRKGMFEDVLPLERVASLQLPLEKAWRLWVADEERRRTGFAAWLVDHSYRAHFNLTTLMDPCELRNSLPQTENRWNASNAQSWAQYPSGLRLDRNQTLEHTSVNATWTTVWPRTGTIGRQVILSELMEQAKPRRSFRCHQDGTNCNGALAAREALESILATMNTQCEEASLHDLKASLTHRVMCLGALMTCHAPDIDLTAVALRQVYSRLHDDELANIAQKWKQSSSQGRTTVYYAAILFETLRSNYATHYAMPVYLLRAVLTLWLYARLFDNSSLTGFSISPTTTTETITPPIKNPNEVDIAQWELAGCTKIRLPGIADLLSPQGRWRLLTESIAAMHSLQGWGISRVFLYFLKRLQASETA